MSEKSYITMSIDFAENNALEYIYDPEDKTVTIINDSDTIKVVVEDDGGPSPDDEPSETGWNAEHLIRIYDVYEDEGFWESVTTDGSDELDSLEEFLSDIQW